MDEATKSVNIIDSDKTTNEIIIPINNDVIATNVTDDPVKDEDNPRRLSVNQTNNITKPCAICSEITTKKGRALECGKCKNLIHYLCTELPPYAVFSIKTSSRVYVCANCVQMPAEFASQWTKNTVEKHLIKTNTSPAITEDVQLTLKSICDSVEKVNMVEYTEHNL